MNSATKSPNSGQSYNPRVPALSQVQATQSNSVHFFLQNCFSQTEFNTLYKYIFYKVYKTQLLCWPVDLPGLNLLAIFTAHEATAVTQAGDFIFLISHISLTAVDQSFPRH